MEEEEHHGHRSWISESGGFVTEAGPLRGVPPADMMFAKEKGFLREVVARGDEGAGLKFASLRIGFGGIMAAAWGKGPAGQALVACARITTLHPP